MADEQSILEQVRREAYSEGYEEGKRSAHQIAFMQMDEAHERGRVEGISSAEPGWVMHLFALIGFGVTIFLIFKVLDLLT